MGLLNLPALLHRTDEAESADEGATRQPSLVENAVRTSVDTRGLDGSIYQADNSKSLSNSKVVYQKQGKVQ
jgi:hypothetical protein